MDTTLDMAMGKEGPNLATHRGEYLRLRKNLVDPESLNRILIPNIPIYSRQLTRSHKIPPLV